MTIERRIPQDAERLAALLSEEASKSTDNASSQVLPCLFRLYGVEMAVNDALSVSYTKEKSDAIKNVTIAAGSSSGTKTTVEADITVMQVAYVVGGATLGINVTDTDNADYVEGKEEKVTMFSLAMAF